MSKIILPEKNIYLPDKYNNYSLFTGDAQSTFEVIFDQLKRDLGCTYMSYALDFGCDKRVAYHSNMAWQKTFIKEGLINICPLIAYAQNIQEGYLMWAPFLKNLRKDQLITTEARADFGIGYGAGFKQKFLGMNEVVAFSATPDKQNFGDKIIHTKVLDIIIKPYVRRFRKIAILSMMQQGFLPQHIVNKILKIFFIQNNYTIH